MVDNANSKKSTFNELDKPQYNSILKLIKRLDDIQLDTNAFNLAEEQIEKIHEKVSPNSIITFL